jgi:hypothetical protein
MTDSLQSIGSGKVVEVRSSTGGGEVGFSTVKTPTKLIELNAGSSWSPHENEKEHPYEEEHG